MDEVRFPELIRRLYAIVEELAAMFPGRKFTPDGHMVGSIGECLAAYFYGVELCAHSTAGHDCTLNGRCIEVKATQGNSVALRSEPDHLLVLRLFPNGTFSEVYNGPGRAVWALVADKPRPKNGQWSVRLNQLRKLMGTVPEQDRLPCVRPVPPGLAKIGVLP